MLEATNRLESRARLAADQLDVVNLIFEEIAQSTFWTGVALICVSLVWFVVTRNLMQSWTSRVIFQRHSREDLIPDHRAEANPLMPTTVPLVGKSRRL